MITKKSNKVILTFFNSIFFRNLMKNKTQNILLILFHIFIFSKAQDLEIPLSEKIEYYKQFSLKEQGLMVFYKSKNKETNDYKWNFIKIDTSLIQLWQTTYLPKKDLEFTDFTYNSDYLYLLFLKNNIYEILQIDIISGEIKSKSGISPFKNVLVEDFKVLNNLAYWGGSIPPSEGKMMFRTGISMLFFPLIFIPNFIPDKEAFAMSVNLDYTLIKNYSFNFKGFSSITDIVCDSISKKSFFLIKNSNRKNNSLYLNEINEEGVRNKSLKISSISKDYYLLNGKLAIGKNGKKAIIGTYSKGKSSGAQGFYFTSFENGKQEFIQYQSFSKFKNFFNYLGEYGKNKIENKIENKRKKGKDISLSYNLLIHDIIVGEDNFKIIAESYFAQYKSEFRTIWINGRPVQQIYEIFDGWRYSHAVIACFNEQGNLIWDDWLPLENTVSYVPEEKVICLDSKEYTHILYNNKGNIISKSINNIKPNLSNNLNLEINTLNFEDNYSNQNQINIWYDNYLIIAKYNFKLNENNSENNLRNLVLFKHKILNSK